MKRIPDLLARAVRRHRSGDRAGAESSCREILTLEPDHPDTLHLLGLLAAEAGHLEAALNLIGRAARIRPSEALYYRNLGAIYHQSRRYSEAVMCLTKALELEPGNAATSVRLGNSLQMLGCWDDAVSAYQSALASDPNHQDALYQLGNTLHAAGRRQEAEKAYDRLLKLKADHVAATFNSAVNLTQLGRIPEAIRRYQKALRLDPGHAQSANNLGILLQAGGKLDEATIQYRRAVRVKPAYVEAHYNLGLALQEQDLFADALAEYDQVLRYRRTHAEALNNRATTLLALGRAGEARAGYEEAIRVNPGHAEARWNLSLVRLLLGEFETGWQGYEWRFRQANSVRRYLDRPAWDGSPLRDRTLLIHAEQGLGDTVQFIRYLPLVRQRCEHTVLECQPRLLPLLEALPHAERLVAWGEPPGAFDFEVPLMSLPRIFGTTIHTVPADVPYLSVESALLETWRGRIGCPGSAKVGLVWGGNAAHKLERHRGIPLAALEPLTGVPGVVFFSLQKGPQAAELATLKRLPFISLDREENLITDTAAILCSLDLVITVDTMIAHLAGALARPVWLLLPFAADWRWLLDRSDSPWYPTMRLFRQPQPGDWRSVVDQVRAELAYL